MRIRFIRAFEGFRRGEIALVTDHAGRAYIDHGFAVPAPEPESTALRGGPERQMKPRARPR